MIETFRNGEISWKLEEYPLFKENTGQLGVLEYMKNFTFFLKRIFFLRKIELNALRGEHSHKELQQVIVCLHGSFELEVNNGLKKQIFYMNESNKVLYLDGKVWRTMKKFSNDAVMLVLCDREYRYDEVVRNYDMFLNNLKEVNDV